MNEIINQINRYNSSGFNEKVVKRLLVTKTLYVFGIQRKI